MCLSRSVPEIHLHVARTLSNQPTNFKERSRSVSNVLDSLSCIVQHRGLCSIVGCAASWVRPCSEPSGKGDFSISVSAQDGIVPLGKVHTRSAPSLSSLPKVARERVPIFVWLNTDRSRPQRLECRPLPFSTPLSFWRSML